MLRQTFLLALIVLSSAGRMVPAQRQATTPVSSTRTHEYAVVSYGAVCDGRANDASALQAAIDAAAADARGGTVVLPAAVCAFSTGLVVGNSDRADTHVNIRGAGAAVSGLKWTGAGSGTALTISRNKYFLLEGFYVTNASGARATTTGMLLTGPSSSRGTMTLVGELRRVNVSNFHLGIQAGVGSPDAAASEIHYSSVELDDNDVGWADLNLNTLDHKFTMLMMVGNGKGLWLRTGNVWVDGGSASNQREADFYIETNYATVTIENYRSENANRLLYASAPGTLAMRGVQAHASSNADRILVEIAAVDGSVALDDNNLYGKVAMTGQGISALRMTNNRVQETGTDLPFAWVARDYGPFGTDVYLQGNDRIDTRTGVITGHFPDIARGRFVTGARDNGSGHIESVFQPNARDVRQYPTSFTQLNRVHMLGFASDADGRNLRETITFAASGTAGVRFRRTITVTTNGAQIVQVPGGSFTVADIGKKLVIPTAGFGGGDAVGFVHAIVDATHIALGVGDGSGGAGSGLIRANVSVTATLGEDEPDASYFLVLGCNADERFYWSSKSPAGFTIASSNPGSTATCDVLIIR